MKYIKKFNESLNNDFEEFVKDELVGLLDNDFHIYVKKSENHFEESYTIYIEKNKKFSWLEINDDITQFFEILRSNYVLESVYVKTASGFSVMRNDEMFSDINSKYYTNINKIVIDVRKKIK
jgi:hypothetical protein